MLNEFQRANFRHHAHFVDQIIDPATSLPIEFGGVIVSDLAPDSGTNGYYDTQGWDNNAGYVVLIVDGISTAHIPWNADCRAVQAAIIATDPARLTGKCIVAGASPENGEALDFDYFFDPEITPVVMTAEGHLSGSVFGPPTGVTLLSGGTGYSIGDALSIYGHTDNTDPAVAGPVWSLNVTAVDGGGAITAVDVGSAGSSQGKAENSTSVTDSGPGSGTGASFSIQIGPVHGFEFIGSAPGTPGDLAAIGTRWVQTGALSRVKQVATWIQSGDPEQRWRLSQPAIAEGRAPLNGAPAQIAVNLGGATGGSLVWEIEIEGGITKQFTTPWNTDAAALQAVIRAAFPEYGNHIDAAGSGPFTVEFDTQALLITLNRYSGERGVQIFVLADNTTGGTGATVSMSADGEVPDPAEVGTLWFDVSGLALWGFNGAWTQLSGAPSLNAVLNVNTSAGSHRINDLQDPSSPQDAATKQYVDDSAGAPLGPSALRLFSPGIDAIIPSASHGNRISPIFAAQEDDTYVMIWLGAQITGTAGSPGGNPTNSLGIAHIDLGTFDSYPGPRLGWNYMPIPAGTRWYVYTYTGGAYDPGVRVVGFISTSALADPDGVIHGFRVVGTGGAGNPHFTIEGGVARIHGRQSRSGQIPNNPVNVSTGDATYDRIDTFCAVYPVDTAFGPDPWFDTVVLTGTAQASPVPPQIAMGFLPLFDVFVPSGATDSSQCTITLDHRVFVESKAGLFQGAILSPHAPQSLPDDTPTAMLFGAIYKGDPAYKNSDSWVPPDWQSFMGTGIYSGECTVSFNGGPPSLMVKLEVICNRGGVDGVVAAQQFDDIPSGTTWVSVAWRTFLQGGWDNIRVQVTQVSGGALDAALVSNSIVHEGESN